MILSLLIVAFILVLIGTPIYIVLGASSFVSLAFFSTIPLEVGVQRIFAGIDKFSLMAIPFFIFSANIMASGGMGDRIINLANLLVGRLKGGLGFTTVLASLFFGAVSGSSPATVASIGKPLFPRLIKNNYPKGFSAGLIVSAGSLGIIIPPSVTMIIYGAVTGASVGKLFLAGIGAGLFFAFLIMIYIYIKARSFDIKIDEKRSTKERIKIVLDAGWGLGVPIIILGGIYGGVFTPTEAAGVSVIYSLLITMFVYRGINMKELYGIILDSARTSSQVMVVIASASVMAWVIATDGITRDIAQMVTSFSTDPLTIMLLINIIFLIGGMFLDGSSLIVIMAPLLVPIGLNVGLDPILLGVLITVNCAIGMFTPPFGLNIFVGSSIMNISIESISKAAIKFVIISIIILILLMLFPQITLWLPSVFDI